MPVSPRHQAAARRAGPITPSANKYEIIDGSHTGKDLGGVTVIMESGKRFVLMLPEQAQWWLDHGVIAPVQATMLPPPETPA